MASDAATSLEDLHELARIYEALEMYSELATTMKKVAELRLEEDSELSVEESNRFSIGLKHRTATLRHALRILQDNLHNIKHERTHAISCQVRRELEAKIVANCLEVNELLERQKVLKTDVGLFLLKMKADYFRYLAEVEKEGEFKASAKAADCYKEASELAAELLDSTHPVRLGLALNYSVFQYEIAGDKEAGVATARGALAQALPHIGEIDDAEKSKELSFILQLLRDNLCLWEVQEPIPEVVSEAREKDETIAAPEEQEPVEAEDS